MYYCFPDFTYTIESSFRQMSFEVGHLTTTVILMAVSNNLLLFYDLTVNLLTREKQNFDISTI